MYDRILVPTDGSDCARTALEHAGDVAAQFDATVRIVHAVDEWNLERLPVGEDSRLQWARELVEEAASSLEHAGVDVETAVEVGVDHEVILAEAASCDVVVMGAVGRSGLERYLLGSVPETVVRTADVPVLTVRDADGPPRFPYRNVLVPTDGSEGAAAAVAHGADLAAACDATLHAVSVVDERPLGLDAASAQLRDSLETRSEAAVADVEEVASAAGVGDVRTAVRSGTPHRALLSYVEEADVDVVVMGTHGRSGLDRLLLGSVTERLLRTSTVPVLSVRRPPATE